MVSARLPGLCIGGTRILGGDVHHHTQGLGHRIALGQERETGEQFAAGRCLRIG